MTNDRNALCRSFFDDLYRREGFNAQRRYPNEEFCRFMGRRYFPAPPAARKDIRILELGTGAGANLWLVAREGFDAYGIDLSEESLKIAAAVIEGYGASAELKAADMTTLPFTDGFFDCVCDVFSSYCLATADYQECLHEVARVLKPAGRFFSHTPSQRSDAFINHHPAKMLDENTLDGVRRKDSPYYGNDYPFRFATPQGCEEALRQAGLRRDYCEATGRTYRNGSEYFEMLTIEAVKPS